MLNQNHHLLHIYLCPPTGAFWKPLACQNPAKANHGALPRPVFPSSSKRLRRSCGGPERSGSLGVSSGRLGFCEGKAVGVCGERVGRKGGLGKEGLYGKEREVNE